MKRLIIFLIRKRLGLKKYERFQFANQNSKDDYYLFTGTNLIKLINGRYGPEAYVTVRSGVSLNWLLDDHCEVIRIDKNN